MIKDKKTDQINGSAENMIRLGLAEDAKDTLEELIEWCYFIDLFDLINILYSFSPRMWFSSQIFKLHIINRQPLKRHNNVYENTWQRR